MPTYADTIADAGIAYYGFLPEISLHDVPNGIVSLTWARPAEKMEIRVRVDGLINWYCACEIDASGNEGWSRFEPDHPNRSPWPGVRRRVRR